MARLRDKESAITREQFRAMTRKEKAEYIFGYYKVHFLLVILAVVVVTVYSISLYTDIQQEDYVHIGVIEHCAADTMAFMDQVAEEENWGEPLAYRTYASTLEGMEGIYQTAGYLANNEVDIIICDSQNLSFFLDSGVSLEEDLVVALLDTELEDNLGGKDLCLIVLNGEERSEKAHRFAELLLKYT